MAINPHPKEKARSQNCAAATTTNDLDHPTAARPDKTFLALRAGFALRGYALYRTDFRDGHVSYWAARLGQAHFMRTLDEAEQFLGKMGSHP